MRVIGSVPCLVLTSLLLSRATLQAAHAAGDPVTVRVYDASGQSSADRAAALAMASGILSAASADVVWRVCSEPEESRGQSASPQARGDDACAAPVVVGELVVRIIPSPVPWPRSSSVALGNALIDVRTGEGVLATVYADRVEWRAAQVRLQPSCLLGRAIAHELGHLLLATREHSFQGLMRAVWTKDELLAGRPSDWSFRPVEVDSIHARVPVRASAAPLMPRRR